MQFKLSIIEQKLLMRVGSPKSTTSRQKLGSQGQISEQQESNFRNIYGLWEAQQHSPGSHVQEFNDMLEKFLHVPDLNAPHKISLLREIRSKRPLLAQTEEKIFSEVIGLVDEIDQLRESLVEHREAIRKIQVENPDVEEQVRYHGYSQPLTQAQCNDLEDENRELIKQIEAFESRQIFSFQEVLRMEKQKYEDLKQELVEGGDQGSAEKPDKKQKREKEEKEVEAKIAQLKTLIQNLQKERQTKVKVHYPGIDRLKSQNQELRQKTITNLKTEQLQSQEERDMIDYLRREEQNRNRFLDELKNFKDEFKRFKAENESMKDRLQKKKRFHSKENSSRRANEVSPSKHSSAKSYMQVENVVEKKGLDRRDRLSQYQNFIKEMQQSLRH